ncbi:MAG: response regulator [Spirochaetes bacterium]|nr:response regulator [Spirochaetota bacterium]
MSGERKKITVVDDNSESLTVLKNIMKDTYEVFPCLSAAKMFDMLEHIKPDLIMLDAEMPEMDGYEAAKKLKSDPQYSEIPIIFLTAKSDTQSEIEGLKLGAIDYIHKPFYAHLFLQRVKTHLSFFEQEREIKHLLELKTKEVKLREEAELKAENASCVKRDFLSHISHEIRSPLNAVIGMINIAIEENDINAIKFFLEKANNAAKLLLDVINDILDLSKIEANKLELSESEFDFGKIITTIIDVTSISAKEKHQDIIVNINPNIPSSIISDELRLTQVISNLMTNAIKFTPEKGKVTLSAEKLEEKNDEITIKVEVEDNGIGISKEQQEKLFKAYQADISITDKFGGTGLRLIIIKHIVELMQGAIWIESELGNGAKFIFTIKVKKGTGNTDKSANSSAGLKKSDLNLKDYTILVAEDMDFNREVIAHYLKKTGITIEFAENGKICVDMFKANPDKYSLIFMDINMPEINGDEATKIIRAYEDKLDKNTAASSASFTVGETRSNNRNLRKQIPIIAMTADVFKEDIEKCLSAGMNDHLSKPLVPKMVLEKVKKYLDFN